MLKYGKIINNETGLCQIGTGTDIEFYKQIGFVELDVEQSEVDNQWYLSEKLQTEEYLAQKSEFEKEKRNMEIQLELEELDKKRVRALCEPQLKNAETGETWLEYYNNQIQELRSQIR